MFVNKSYPIGANPYKQGLREKLANQNGAPFSVAFASGSFILCRGWDSNPHGKIPKRF